MKSNMTSKVQTLVKIMVILSLSSSPTALAQPVQKTDAQVACAGASDVAKCILDFKKQEAAMADVATEDICGKSARDSYKEAKRKIGEACADAGFGGNCYNDVLDCSESFGSQDFNTMGVLSQVTGISLDAAAGTSNCPQLSGKDYFTAKKEIESDIKDANDELADLEKEKSDMEDDFNKEMQEIQKEIREAQKDLEDQKLEISQEKRERLSDFNKQQAETRAEVRKKNMDMLQLRGKLIKSDRDKATKMLQLSEGTTKRACTNAVSEMRDKYLKAGSRLSIKEARKLKTDLTASFDDCMKNFDQQRGSLNETYRQEQSEIQATIDQLQSDIDDMENQLKLAQTQVSEMETDSKKKQTAAEENLTKMMQESSTKMQASQQTLQKRLAALNQKQTTVKTRLTKLNNELMALGPVPADRSSEDTPKKALSKISAEIETVEGFESQCMSKGSKKKKSSSSGVN